MAPRVVGQRCRWMSIEFGASRHPHSNIVAFRGSWPRRRRNGLLRRPDCLSVVQRPTGDARRAVRGTDATHPMKAISERLGHASIITTMDTYAHLRPAMDHDAAANFDAAIQRPVARAATTRACVSDRETV